MQTQPTPISQIVSPNATPGPANRSQQPTADGDFQRALDRQLEQRQLSSKAAQAQSQAPAPAQPPQPSQQAQAAAQTQATQQAAQQPAAKTPASEAAPTDAAQAANTANTPASSAKDSDEPEQAASVANTAAQQAPEDPAAAMLALVGSIKLAMQQPAAAGKAAAETPASPLAAKSAGKGLTAAQLLASGKVPADTANGVSKGATPAADFADSLGQAQGKAAAPLQGAGAQAGKTDAGKLAIDLQVAAAGKSAAPLAEPLLKEAPTDIGKLAAQLQPAALQQAAAAAVPADKLAGRVGTPAWDQQLGQKVVWMAAGGDQSATLTLNPPDLGPLQVVLTVTNDQANAAFMSAQPEVRQALEAAMPRLREMMGEAGIAFGNATVSAGTQEQQNQGNREMASDGRRGSHGNSGSNVTGGEIAIAPATASRARASLSAVDTFA
ncbi:flagellar hook-length control protein FliK [Janthinobacterium sp.]|uniref:flagellar hook-length control protein FliK n=1 Tax=Janthinobacterium sp. TaxID=1871054 RepID=UPI0026294C63|nr:flagellar hook-length control protein FliK [Janthinobacterium sp.]